MEMTWLDIKNILMSISDEDLKKTAAVVCHLTVDDNNTSNVDCNYYSIYNVDIQEDFDENDVLYTTPYFYCKQGK